MVMMNVIHGVKRLLSESNDGWHLPVCLPVYRGWGGGGWGGGGGGYQPFLHPRMGEMENLENTASFDMTVGNANQSYPAKLIY